MKVTFSYISCILLSLSIHHSLFAHNSTAPFTSHYSDLSSTIHLQCGWVKLISFQGCVDNNKVMLHWEVSENEVADQFEVEKSVDGKNFSMAALVFGTDKPHTDSYMFYEKSITKKMLYRIKIIDKKGNITYSDALTIDPKDNK
ncbi:MAG TPA: hypothetical protein VET23_10850 [Chitinophagaceae bacterium]|nr:hypothetical protein [Chitinophagaceae bacterium]